MAKKIDVTNEKIRSCFFRMIADDDIDLFRKILRRGRYDFNEGPLKYVFMNAVSVFGESPGFLDAIVAAGLRLDAGVVLTLVKNESLIEHAVKVYRLRVNKRHIIDRTKRDLMDIAIEEQNQKKIECLLASGFKMKRRHKRSLRAAKNQNVTPKNLQEER